MKRDAIMQASLFTYIPSLLARLSHFLYSVFASLCTLRISAGVLTVTDCYLFYFVLIFVRSYRALVHRFACNRTEGPEVGDYDEDRHYRR